MAACYLEQVRIFQPTGPYYLGGYCLGGNVAYEMARQLHADGEEVALVALLDSAPSNAGYESISWWRPGYGLRFARNLYYWLNDFSALTPEVRFRFVIRKSRALLRKLLRFHKGPSSETAVDLEDVIDPKFFPDNELARWQVHLRALIDHIEQPYSGCVTLFRTRGQPLFCSLEEDFCWSRLAEGGVEIKRIPGSHESIFIEPNVQILAASLGACLDGLKSDRHTPKTKSLIGEQIPVSGDIEALIPD
jgi:thioesterase domain-containing protein